MLALEIIDVFQPFFIYCIIMAQRTDNNFRNHACRLNLQLGGGGTKFSSEITALIYQIAADVFAHIYGYYDS